MPCLSSRKLVKSVDKKAPFSRVRISNNLCSVPPPRKRAIYVWRWARQEILRSEGAGCSYSQTTEKEGLLKPLRAALCEPHLGANSSLF
jgi:hypothetical protein